MDPNHPELDLSPREELEALIATDEGRIGDVFRLSAEGRTPQEIADQLNVASHAFVYNNRRQIDAVLDGRAVNGPVFRRQTIGVFSNLIKRGRTSLSAEAMKLLLANKAAVEAAGLDEDPLSEATAAADEEREAASTLASLEGQSGIYAFSYGWYLESPVDPERGNTLIKVGQSVNVAQRIREHTSKARAHMPEPLALIRVYSTEDRDAGHLERGFHELLRTAGHSNPRRIGREVGVEWFLTNEDFLDAIASTLGMRTLYTGRSEFAAD
jgi:hypothetical protein